MAENIFHTHPEGEEPARTAPEGRTWTYSEKTPKQTVNHTITVTPDRFTHTEESSGRICARQRTDINLKNARSATVYFGLTKNIWPTVLLSILAVLMFVGAIVALEESSDEAGISLMVLTAVCGFLAWLVYRIGAPKTVLFLEFETVVPNGTLMNHSLSHSGGLGGQKKHRISPLFYILLITPLMPIALIYILLKLGGKNKMKYKFIIDESVGNEIVDTFGDIVLSE